MQWSEDGKYHSCFLSMNGCGFTSMKRFPELYDVLSEIDFACLLKTKLDDLDEVDLAGFTCFMKKEKVLDADSET